MAIANPKPISAGTLITAVRIALSMNSNLVALKPFVESDDCELWPQTPCGEYHVLTLRLNRTWLRRLRAERNQKQERLNESLALLDELERTVNAQPDPEAEVKVRLLSFLRNEIEALQRELSIAIPFIAKHEEADIE